MALDLAARDGALIDSMVVQRLLKGVDFSVLTAGALLASFAHGHGLAGDAAPAMGFLSLGLALVSMLAIRGLNLYEIAALSDPARSTAWSLAASFVAGGGCLVLANAAGVPLTQDWLAVWLALVTGHFAITRLGVAAWVAPRERAGRFRRRIAIVGAGPEAEHAIALLEASPGLDIEIVGLFDDRFDARGADAIRSHRRIGKIAELADYARAKRVDLIVVAIPLAAEARLLQILKRLWELPVDIRISGEASSLKFSPRAYTRLGDLPLLAVFDRPLGGWGGFLKASLDKAIALAAIVALAPLMALTALAVKIESKGPVLFRQKRYGFNNELIEVYKFRSMYIDMSDATASKLVTRGDPRVTRIGRFIRKTSIDELPQLFNVLTGQLSLVGPRPHATQAKAADHLYHEVVDGYFARHKVKPGITGWAQVNGWRGETDTREKLEQRVKHDLEYIDRWSLGFDLLILARTPLALMKTRNAY